MKITEVRILLMRGEAAGNDRLRAFASIVVDDMLVIRDVKVVEGAKGLIVAMPSRRIAARCESCGTKNHLRASYCNQCGGRLDERRAIKDMSGKAKLHADVAHPINAASRVIIDRAVLEAYWAELRAAAEDGYRAKFLDFDAMECAGVGEIEAA